MPANNRIEVKNGKLVRLDSQSVYHLLQAHESLFGGKAVFAIEGTFKDSDGQLVFFDSDYRAARLYEHHACWLVAEVDGVQEPIEPVDSFRLAIWTESQHKETR